MMNKNIAFFFLSLSFYQTGNWLQNTALNFSVYSSTGSTLKVGIVQFLQYAPLLFLPLIGGTLIDRLNKYMMLMFTQFTLMILSFFLYLATKNGINSVHLEVLYIVVLMGILKTFDIPLRQTVMAHLVDKDKLRNATSIYSTIVNLSRFLGPFLFGVVVSFSSVHFSFLLSALLMTASVLVLFFLRYDFQKEGKTYVVDNFLNVIDFLFQNEGIRNIFLLTSIAGVFGWFFYVLLPEYTYNILKLPSYAYGYLTSFAGIGSVAGSLSLLVIRKLSIFMLMRVGILTYTFGTLLWFAALYFYPLLGLGIFLNGYGLSLFYACANAYVQLFSPLNIKGRLLSLYTSIFIGTQPLSFILGGLLESYLGIWRTLLFVISAYITIIFFIRR